MIAAITHDVDRQQDRLFHDVLSSAETIAIRREVRDFSTNVVRPAASAIGGAEESKNAFPWAVFRALGAEGLFRIPFASPHGRGLERPASATATAIEELAYWSNSVAAIYDVHCILAGHALEVASDSIRARYLKPLVEGTKVGAFATTEPNASSDLSPTAVTTLARREGDDWIVEGRKRFITNSPVADFVVTLCRTDSTLTLFVVDLNAPGVRVGRPDRKMGNRAQLTADVYFEGARVPAANLVGEQGQGLRIALQTLTYGRIGIAATGVGLAQAAFDIAVDHMKTRKVFGKHLAEMQHWQFRMAEHATAIENARSLYLKAALRMDEGVRFPDPEAAMAKAYGTALAVDVARDAIQILGGYGFLRELAAEEKTFRLEEIYRDAKIGEIYEGANEIQKWIIARSIFGKEMTG